MKLTERMFAYVLLALAMNVHSQVKSVQNSADVKRVPTLGFAKAYGNSPVEDFDAREEEREAEDRLPSYNAPTNKRISHEKELRKQFVAAFQNSKECSGITLTDKKPEFIVGISVKGHDKTPQKQEWSAMLEWPGNPKYKKELHELVWVQSNATMTARYVCSNIWAHVDSTHLKSLLNGKIE
jgi:hypothetical protein